MVCFDITSMMALYDLLYINIISIYPEFSYPISNANFLYIMTKCQMQAAKYSKVTFDRRL